MILSLLNFILATEGPRPPSSAIEARRQRQCQQEHARASLKQSLMQLRSAEQECRKKIWQEEIDCYQPIANLMLLQMQLRKAEQECRQAIHREENTSRRQCLQFWDNLPILALKFVPSGPEMQIFIHEDFLRDSPSKFRGYWREKFFKSLAEEGVIVYPRKGGTTEWGIARWKGPYPGSLPPPSGYSEAWFSHLEFTCNFPGGSPAGLSVFFVYQLPGTDKISCFSLDGGLDPAFEEHVCDQISEMNFTMADRLLHFLNLPEFTEKLTPDFQQRYKFSTNQSLQQLCQYLTWQPTALDLFG